MQSKKNPNLHYKMKQKRKVQNLLFGMGATAILFALFAVTTVVFIWALQHADAQKVVQKPQSGVPVAASSAARQSGASSGSSAASSQAGDSAQLSDWKLVLVNYANKMPDHFDSKVVAVFGMQMDSRVVQPYTEMLAAAKKDGISLWISSAYRSPEKQQELFEQEIKNYSKGGVSEVEAIAKAEQSVARPGYSEHNTGLALDLNGVKENFGGTPASNWLEEHAPDYGFILRFPRDKQEITKIKYEAWHYRYVGVENAKKMKEMNLCLEEYVDYLKKNPDSGN